MLKIIGDNVYRNGEKVGWVERNYVLDHRGIKLGYFDNKFIYNHERRRQAYIEGDHLYSEGSKFSKISLDKINEDIEGGILPMIAKAAVYVLLGG